VSRIDVNKRNGSKGGTQTAKSMSEDDRKERARSGGQSTLMRYGSEYYKGLAKRSRGVQVEAYVKTAIVRSDGTVDDTESPVKATVTKSGRVSFDGAPLRKDLTEGERVRIAFEIDYDVKKSRTLVAHKGDRDG
jgi:hypothetical protein